VQTSRPRKNPPARKRSAGSIQVEVITDLDLNRVSAGVEGEVGGGSGSGSGSSVWVPGPGAVGGGNDVDSRSGRGGAGQ